MTTMKSKLAIEAELSRVEKAMHSKPHPHPGRIALQGAQQALSWALGEDAMPPARCFTRARVRDSRGGGQS